MKIKTISRSAASMTRERAGDIEKVMRNYDPSLHPFQRAREYKRAVNAAKMDRMFAKPFIGALDGHADNVFAMATSPTSLVTFLSGAGDGEIRLWDLTHRKTVASVYGHDRDVRGLVFDLAGTSFFSCGSDSVVKQWKIGGVAVADDDDDDDEEEEEDDDNDDDDDDEGEGYKGKAAAGSKRKRSQMSKAKKKGAGAGSGSGAGAGAGKSNPFRSSSGGSKVADTVAFQEVAAFAGKSPFQGIDHHWKDSRFATVSTALELWDPARSTPVHSFNWGVDSMLSCKFNPAERCLVRFGGVEGSRGREVTEERRENRNENSEFSNENKRNTPHLTTTLRTPTPPPPPPTARIYRGRPQRLPLRCARSDAREEDVDANAVQPARMEPNGTYELCPGLRGS